ncbi:c-type cytochrome [Chthonobacter albigriseus]|uniref:c-type cytochrome n=1 Tax=Chthonobacter albigriseus TaxID=1683161 RepID=UPI0015EE7837|nr:cytochrome c [Chthonobacter albigriseus]
MNSRLLASVFGLAALSVVSTMAVAQEDPIKAREELMEEIGDQMKILGPMAQGKADYDAAKAAAALEKISANAADFPNHFPEGSDQGKTEALPAIWENKADFEAKSKQLSDDAKAAVTAAAGGLEAFKPAFGQMASNCKSCHEKYRKPS